MGDIASGKSNPTFKTLACLLVAVFFLAACGRQNKDDESSHGIGLGDGLFSVMTFNVGRYGYHDRTGDGQKGDLKPDAERNAVITIIRDASPDVLAIQEIGGPVVFEGFKRALASEGISYAFEAYLQREQSEMNLAVLSRYPIIATHQHVDDMFSVGDEQIPVKRGFLEVDIAVHPGYQFRMLVAQLKSKEYHPLGQTEMRRSEARLLNNHVRRALSRNPRMNLLVVGDMNDHVRSAPLRTLMGNQQEFLNDLRPTDAYGEIWTAFEEVTETYHRYDYILVSPYMLPEYVAEKSNVIRHPLNKASSARRPLFAVFQARDIVPLSAPLLPSYEQDSP